MTDKKFINKKQIDEQKVKDAITKTRIEFEGTGVNIYDIIDYLNNELKL